MLINAILSVTKNKAASLCQTVCERALNAICTLFVTSKDLLVHSLTSPQRDTSGEVRVWSSVLGSGSF